MKRELILIKLGGSLVTDKNRPFSLRLRVIQRLCKEIHKAKGKLKNTYITAGHGGGSFPHVPAKKYKTHEGIINEDSLKGIAEVQDAASRLNRIIVKELIKAKENAVSFSPSSFMLAKSAIVNGAFIKPLHKSLEIGLLPVVYGDVVLDVKKGCVILSTETVLSFLARKLRKNFDSIKIIYCGITDGVYDKDGKTIKKITPLNFNEVKHLLGGSEGIDVTGGMIHKVKEALDTAKSGIPTVIINGSKKGELENAVLDRSIQGTYIQRDRVSSK